MSVIKVLIKNKATGALSEVPADVWRTAKNTPAWRGVFEVVNVVKEPPEVAELKARLRQQNLEK